MVSHVVCVMTRAQQVVANGGKMIVRVITVTSDNDDDSSNDSFEEQEDHQRKEKNSKDEKDDMFKENKHNKVNEERQIATNNDSWKAYRKVHRKVSKTIHEIQEEEGEALSMPEEFAPWYPEEKKIEKLTKQSLEKGGVPTTT